jgi:acetoin utilization protein AcuC
MRTTKGKPKNTFQNLQISYSDDYLNWQLGDGDGSHPTDPMRARIAYDLLNQYLGHHVTTIDPAPRDGDRAAAEALHAASYVRTVLDEGLSTEWEGPSLKNAHTALAMFSGTMRLTEAIIAGETRIGFNPMGAKHHAGYDFSSGFCVLNDMAWGALAFKEAGIRPLYLDWDVHAGDGVQNLLEDTDIPTLSIHGTGIFPAGMGNHHPDKFGQGHTWHDTERHFYNWNIELGSGDEALLSALDEAEDIVAGYAPDVILLATGADGHYGEYWGMKWTLDGYVEAAHQVSTWADKFLIGGAGGYQPRTWTPDIWATVVREIYRKTRRRAL